MATCHICKKEFDEELHKDCGGDCLSCMSAIGDPDCVNAVRERVTLALKEGRLVFAIGKTAEDAKSIFDSIQHETYGVTVYLPHGAA